MSSGEEMPPEPRALIDELRQNRAAFARLGARLLPGRLKSQLFGHEAVLFRSLPPMCQAHSGSPEQYERGIYISSGVGVLPGAVLPEAGREFDLMIPATGPP